MSRTAGSNRAPAPLAARGNKKATGTHMTERHAAYNAEDLETLAAGLLAAAGMDKDKAAVVAKGLTEGELMGATTHGLALLPPYVRELEERTMTASGDPEVITNFGAVALWDGRYLPGVWLTREAGLEASRKAKQFGIGLVTVRRSHHIACLGQYLLEAVARNEIMIVYTSDPSDTHVAPFGGTTPVLTPNPIAAGIPAKPWPILIDASTSVTTAGLCERSHREHRKLPAKWLQLPSGELTDDPSHVRPARGRHHFARGRIGSRAQGVRLGP